MFCKNCGKETEDENIKYCPECGTSLNDQDLCPKNWLYTFILNWLLGCTGAHRFYTGYIGIGIAQLLTFGGLGIWSLVDMISIGLNKYRNAKGEELEGYIKPIGLLGIAYAIMIVTLVIFIIFILALTIYIALMMNKLE